MEDNARDFGLFIDGLRIDRNLSREDLIDNIISLSQYKRYLRGASSIPNSILVQLADRLKFSISDIHLMFRSRSDNQYNEVLKIYQRILSREYEKAWEMANKIKIEAILSQYNQLFFDFCLISIQHNLQMVSDVHVLGMYSKLIDYPNCANNDSFNWVEVNALLQIVLVSAKMDNYEPSRIMYETMISDRFMSSYTGEKNFLPNVYASLSRILGSQKSYQQSVDLTQQGIDYCIKYKVSTSLSTLYFFNSLSNYDLENFEASSKSLKKALMQCYLDNDKSRLEYMIKTYSNKPEIDINDIINLVK